MPLGRARADAELLVLFDASAQNVRRMAVLVRDLFAEHPEADGRAQAIVACEHDGDRIAHDILHRLAELPPRRVGMDPADVHALAGALDDVVDFAEEAAGRLAIYGVEATMQQADQLCDVLVGCAGHVAASLAALRAGQDPGAHLVDIHRLEHEGDRIVRDAVASLFAEGIDPLTLIRWKDIYDTLEAAIDACETVANVLEGMTLKRSRFS
jgi:uncharacterized protein Yka (UPF0111/DUF47 family)